MRTVTFCVRSDFIEDFFNGKEVRWSGIISGATNNYLQFTYGACDVKFTTTTVKLVQKTYQHISPM